MEVRVRNAKRIGKVTGITLKLIKVHHTRIPYTISSIATVFYFLVGLSSSFAALA
jgi:hypothetical protein